MLDCAGLQLRDALLRSVRTFFHRQGFLEVDTPILYPVLLPERHIVPLSCAGRYLQPSPEQCMKRLLARGCDKIYQICHCFRGEERGRLHLPEFTMLEWYRRQSDYRDLMNDCEFLVRRVVDDLRAEGLVSAPVEPVFARLATKAPWQRLTVHEAFRRYCPLTAEQALLEDRFDELMVTLIEPRLGRTSPTFLVDYPAARGSLARLRSDDPGVAERFELYIDGVELANGFSELSDPEEQRRRFVDELAEGISSGEEAPEKRLPHRFLEELSAMGPAAGIAFGLDRFFMVLLAADGIDAAVSFVPEDL